MSSVPVTLWSFYRSLPTKLAGEGIEVHICSSMGFELDFFERHNGVKTWPVSMSRKITPFSDLLSVFKLVKIFKYQRFDIVHAHTPKAGLLGMIAAKLAGVKNRIYTCHGLPMETERGLKKFILRISEKTSFIFATQVLVVSPSLLQKLRDYGVYNGKKAMVLLDGTACGVDLKRFTKNDEFLDKANRIRNELSIRDSEILIGFVGRIVPDKGIDVLLDAFSILCSKYDNIRLIVIGDYEPHRGRLSSDHIKLLNSHEKIICVGFTRQIEEYYVAMNILVLPTKREGFPYTLLEAAAMELPVVATKVTGCIDAVVDGETGLLVEPQNSLLLSTALEKLIQSEQLRDQMGCNARERIKEKFTSERLLDAHVKLYQSLLGI